MNYVKNATIDEFTCSFLKSINLEKYDMAPSEYKYREVKLYKLNQVAQPGDHIAVWRESRGYWHHGIYMGDNENEDSFVVDLTPDNGIDRRPFEDFIHGEDAAIVIDYGSCAFSKEDTLIFAQFAVKFATVCPIQYDPFKRKCDKLALMLRTGRYDCEWLNTLLRKLKPEKIKRASYSISAKLLNLHKL